MGAFLKNHPEIDFSEVSYYRIEEEKSKMKLFLFYISDNQVYGYTKNGEKIEGTRDEDNNNVFEVRMDENCSCKIIYYQDGKINYAVKSMNGLI